MPHLPLQHEAKILKGDKHTGILCSILSILPVEWPPCDTRAHINSVYYKIQLMGLFILLISIPNFSEGCTHQILNKINTDNVSVRMS